MVIRKRTSIIEHICSLANDFYGPVELNAMVRVSDISRKWRVVCISIKARFKDALTNK